MDGREAGSLCSAASVFSSEIGHLLRLVGVGRTGYREVGRSEKATTMVGVKGWKRDLYKTE